MGWCWGNWVTIDGHPVCIGDRSAKITVGIVATIALSGLAGGGLGGATPASGSGSEYGARPPQSQQNARPKPDEPEAGPGGIPDSFNGITDSFKVTSRLEKLGHRVVKVYAKHDDGNCADNSDGQARRFFREVSECISLYREVIEVQETANTFLFTMATIVMPDHDTAFHLRLLLDQAVNGEITRLVPDWGKYRNMDWGATEATTSLNNTTVTTYDVKIVGRTLVASVADSFLNEGLSGLR